jgi:hypothetical protein
VGGLEFLGAILSSSMSNGNVKRESVPYRNGALGGSFQIRWLLLLANLVGPGDLKRAPLDISLGHLLSDMLTMPLPFSTKEEFQLFVQPMKRNPSPIKKTFQEMAGIIRALSNAENIFPKLVSMVKSHHEQWRANQQIRQLRASTLDNFSKVLQSVGAQRATLSETRTRLPREDLSSSGAPQLEQFFSQLTAPKQTNEVQE